MTIIFFPHLALDFLHSLSHIPNLCIHCVSMNAFNFGPDVNRMIGQFAWNHVKCSECKSWVIGDSYEGECWICFSGAIGVWKKVHHIAGRDYSPKADCDKTDHSNCYHMEHDQGYKVAKFLYEMYDFTVPWCCYESLLEEDEMDIITQAKLKISLLMDWYFQIDGMPPFKFFKWEECVRLTHRLHNDFPQTKCDN